MSKRLQITVHGRVQNVGFRHKAVQEANRYGVRGFVMNKPNGQVYIEAEGPQTALDPFLAWCKHGPQWASVDDIQVEEAEPEGFEDFSVQYRNVY